MQLVNAGGTGAGTSARVAITLALAGLALTGLIERREQPNRVAIHVSCENEALCALAEARSLDVWSEHTGPGLPIDLVVDSGTLDELAELGVSWDVIDPDIDATAAAEMMRLQFRVRCSAAYCAQGADWFAEYRDYREINTYLAKLQETWPDRVRVEGIGSSLDGNPIYAWKIGRGPETMLINGTQHAREWISPMVNTCIADRMVREYDSNPKIKQFVDTTTLWVVPVVNPDGYQHSWSTSRFWRKNRRDGHGVDLNRNWGVAWGGSGSSSNKRSETYRGSKEFSEPETIALRDLAARVRPATHIDFHAYGQLILYPWDYTSAPAKDKQKLAAVGDNIASAMFVQHDKRYRLIQGVELYPSAGTANDWLYGELGTLSYAIELRPKSGAGSRGFVLPPEEIKPTCDEGLAAVLALRSIGGKQGR